MAGPVPAQLESQRDRSWSTARFYGMTMRQHAMHDAKKGIHHGFRNSHLYSI